MSKLENAQKIEAKVGAKRHATDHLGRAVSVTQRVYVLHSKHCKNTTPDLRDCEYSIALDLGIDLDVWKGFEDQAVELAIDPDHDDLVPVPLTDSEAN